MYFALVKWFCLTWNATVEKNSKEQQSSHSLNSYQVKTQNILAALSQLFQPFREVLLSVFPSSKWLIRVFDFIGFSVSRVVLLVLEIIPLAVKIFKGKSLKILILLCFLLILANTIITRMLSTTSYKNTLASALTHSLGYNTVIEGKISVNLLTQSVTINDAGFYSPVNKGSHLALNLLAVNHFKIKFSLPSLLVGKLKAKAISMDRANLKYRLVSNPLSASNEDFSAQASHIEEELAKNLANVGLKQEGKVTANSTNASHGEFLVEHSSDLQTAYLGRKQYLNLKNVFLPKEQNVRPTFVNIDNQNFIYKLLLKLSNGFNLDVAQLNSVELKNVTFQIMNTSGASSAFQVNNFSGLFKRNLGDKRVLTGEGRIFGENMAVNLLIKPANTGDTSFNLQLFQVDGDSQKKAIDVQGVQTAGQYSLDGSLQIQGAELAKLLSSMVDDSLKVDPTKSLFKSHFSCKDALLNFTDSTLVLNGVEHTGGLHYNFADEGALSVALNLKIPDLDVFSKPFAVYKKLKQGNDISVLEDMLLEWKNSKHALFTPRYLAVDLTVNHTKLRGNPIDSMHFRGFLDEDDTLYLQDYALKNPNFSFALVGKVDLDNKTARFVSSSAGSLSGVAKFLNNSPQLDSFLLALGGGSEDSYNLSSKLLVTNSAVILNSINGNFGAQNIADFNATLEGGSKKVLTINGRLDSVCFDDLFKIYKADKHSRDIYFETSNNITGLSNSLTIDLQLHSSKFKWRSLTFSDFDIQGSIISSGVLVHKFSFSNEQDDGSASGAFNFNTAVTPAIVGNIDFNHLLIDVTQLSQSAKGNYALSGKVVLNGSINVTGQDYYEGVDKICGSLNLLHYTRYKLNRNNEMPGLYLTLVRLLYQGRNYYQIADLYGHISINNNLVDFSPSVIRYIDAKNSYRGTIKGSIDLLNHQLNIKTILHNERSTKLKDKKVVLEGSLLK